jgi:hypothetical protein
MSLAPDAVVLPPPPITAAPEVRQWFVTIKDIVDRLNLGVLQGNGSPAGVIVADVGTLYRRLNGGAGTTLYVKESGSGTSAGWVAK